MMPGLGFTALGLEGAWLVEGFYAGDSRGGLTKFFEAGQYLSEGGIRFSLTESFASTSARGVVRGLHFQLRRPQAKLVTVLYGRAWDVIVDLRPESPTFAGWYAHELSADNHLALYVPRGFAHGFASLDDGTVMLYQCDGPYDAGSDSGIKFDDPDIGIEWPIPEHDAIHSERDLSLGSLASYLLNPMQL